MCTTCGCASGDTQLEGEALHRQEHEHQADGWHVHADGTAHSHTPAHGYRQGKAGKPRLVEIEQDILAKNNAYAEQNRKVFDERGIFALNLVSSPGSGKTTLLVKTIEALRDEVAIRVVEGDQQTANDAERIRATGVPAVQINTGKGCHLDAHMVAHAIERLNPPAQSLFLIENVGNLVCPAAFALGEHHKVAILSVTEGEDKPLKYPDMFRAADVLLLNKCDLLPYLEFDIDLAEANARRVNPGIIIFRVAATKGEGMAAWLEWLYASARMHASRQVSVAKPASTQQTDHRDHTTLPSAETRN